MNSNAILNASGVTASTGDIVASSGSVQANTMAAASTISAGGLITAGSGIQSNGAISSVGNISSDGNISGATVSATGAITAGTNVVAGSTVSGNAVSSTTAVTAGTTMTAGGNIVSNNGDIQSVTGKVEGNSLVTDTTVSLALGAAVKGSGCTSGTIGLDTTGKLYACVGGLWVSSSGYNAVTYGPLRTLSYSTSAQSQTDTIGSSYSLCAISYVLADQNSASCQVYQANGTWYMYTATAAGAAAGCQAVCLPQ